MDNVSIVFGVLAAIGVIGLIVTPIMMYLDGKNCDSRNKRIRDIKRCGYRTQDDYKYNEKTWQQDTIEK